ncbi:MAG: hypothetical protein JO026_03150 [Patescibacteria group bacterium]|nr:hypothetical protein [Patescibacteria group bacterium]
MNKLLVWCAVILGVIFLIGSFMYFTTSAGALPGFMPGFQTGATNIHYKHAIASLLVGVALFAFAWFQSKPKKSA